MRDYHGLIFAYNVYPALRELVSVRTAASLPFCGRYRLIDLALSSMRNAGILDVGVVMQRDYQSLLDHIGSGKAWDMSRRTGGLRMLPPFGLPEYHTGNYNGTIEALNSVAPYIRDLNANHIVLLLGNLCANVDLTKAIRQHNSSGADITAICADHDNASVQHRFVVGEDGLVERMLLYRQGGGEGLPTLEGYIIHKDLLLDLMDRCKAQHLYNFHQDALPMFFADGGKMDVYVHQGYSRLVCNVEDFYAVNLDMLDPEKRRQVFPADRPVRTKAHEEVSAYYSDTAVSRRSLVADNCIIEGEIEDSIIFSGARVAPGAKLKGCVVMRGCTIGEGVELENVIADKHCSFSAGVKLTGSPKLPMVVPKNSKI